MSKKILFTAYNLDLGGIESALINLLKILDPNKYDVTLVLEKKEGIFLDDVPPYVKIETYNIHNDNNVFLRKIKNRFKLWKWILKNYHKYDFAGCFTTYSIPGSILSRFASSNNAFWVHSNYYNVYNKDEIKIRKFFEDRKISKFKKIVFVANEAKRDFLKIYPSFKNKAVVQNNILNYQEIERKSKDKLDIKKPKETLFVFVGRLEENSKRLSRLIESMSLLKEKHKAVLWIIGDGPDYNFYQKLVKDLNLTKQIFFLGKKQNPYPYIAKADLIVLTSDYEGFPVVCLEAMILKKPFLSTVGLSDPYIKLSDYGKIINKNTKEIVTSLEEFLTNQEVWDLKNFDPLDYQKKLVKDLEALIEGGK